MNVINKFWEDFKNNIAAIRDTCEMPHGTEFVSLSLIQAITSSVLPAILTIFPGLIINQLIGERNIHRILIYVAILVLLPVFLHFFNFIINKRILILSQSLDNAFTEKYYECVSNIDYEYLEQPRIKSLKSRVENTMLNKTDIVSNLCQFITIIITFVSILSVIVALNPLLIFILSLLIFFNYLSDNKTHSWNNARRTESSLLTNIESVYSFYLDNFDYIKENRIYGFTEILLRYYFKNRRKIDDLSMEGYMVKSSNSLFHVMTNCISQVCIYVYAIYGILTNNISVGELSILLAASAQFSGLISSFMQMFLVLKDNSEKIKEVMEFIGLPSKYRTDDALIPKFDKYSIIEFDHVTFRYPGSEDYVLHDFNIIIKGNERLAIVGENGAGKSTFIKLLLRLYVPESGEIRLNGINIERFDLKKYTALFAPVFQDFAEYDLPFRDCIVSNQLYNEKIFKKICRQCKLSKIVDRLPLGIDTQIGREINDEGYEPSGGESQRIAIARAIYRNSYICLLDEPTAALDPNAEYEIYMQFHNMIVDKCAIIITHRLSAVQLADKVAVFSDGIVAEYGTHADLYTKGGIYTEMFDKQAHFYRDMPTENVETE